MRIGKHSLPRSMSIYTISKGAQERPSEAVYTIFRYVVLARNRRWQRRGV